MSEYILLDKRTDFIKKLMSLTESGLPIHIAQALLRDAAGSDANWHMRSMGIPSHVASEMDRVVGQAYQAWATWKTAVHPDARRWLRVGVCRAPS